jgi:cytoskeletal protein RodZ
MKEKIKGKIFVGMIISILAFGLATGTSVVIGTNPLNSSGIINLTQQGQFPSLPFSPSNTTSNNQQTVDTTTTPTTTTTNPQQTTTPSKTSNTSTKNNNTSSPTKTKTNTTTTTG